MSNDHKQKGQVNAEIFRRDAAKINMGLMEKLHNLKFETHVLNIWYGPSCF